MLVKLTPVRFNWVTDLATKFETMPTSSTCWPSWNTPSTKTRWKSGTNFFYSEIRPFLFARRIRLFILLVITDWATPLFSHNSNREIFLSHILFYLLFTTDQNNFKAKWFIQELENIFYVRCFPVFLVQWPI